uniref:Protein kinase domain-containing protein n=1 Tax=Physcomitrium patens TaxID=3218 RepID=A0A7I4CSB3_PHYPA
SQLATAVYSSQGGFSPNAAESVYGEMNSRGQEVKVEFIDTSSKDPGRITNPIQRPGMSANLEAIPASTQLPSPAQPPLQPPTRAQLVSPLQPSLSPSQSPPSPIELPPSNVPSPLPAVLQPTPPTSNAPVPTPIANLDLQALLYFKGHVTADPNSVFKLWSNTNNPNSCNWFGVTCGHVGDNVGRVISLSLPNRELEGNLTSWKEVVYLPYLEILDLGGNKLRGSIPEELGALKRLRVLLLNGNSFRGSFPPRLSSCVTMEELDVQGCGMTDVYPEMFVNFRGLSLLNLGDNYFSGPIPMWLGWSPVLRYLHLGGNRFSGDLPITLLNCTSLMFLNISSNNLTGSVDSMIGNPDMSRNQFSGRIPFELGNLRDVVGINLSGNSFTGNIPPSIGNCSKLQSLDLADNKLGGSLPETLSLLRNLKHVLNFSHNVIGGLIPGSLGSLHDLSKLDLSQNKLTGPITESIAGMRSLLILNISVNNLRGRVWDTGIFRNLSAESFLGNPGLCGRLVGRPCPGDMVSPLVRSHHKKGPSLVTIIGAAVERVVLIFFALLLVRYIIYRRGSVQADTVVLFSEYLKSLELTAEEIQAATAFTDASGSVSGTFSRSLSGNIRRAIGFSNIEKAVLPDGTVFAVKQWIIAKVRKKERLMLDSEMLNLSKIRHRNLLMGYSTNSSTLGLFVEFMPNGSLDLHLHPPGKHNCQLKWNERLRIIMGITAGLVCLHHETCGNALAHCGLKAANVLLDSDMESKLVDFGMARLIKRSIKGSSAASWIVSSGYAPPEHGVSSELTTAGDVYSYGVLILEIITGKRPTIEEVRVGVTLPAWVQDLRDQSAIDVSLFQSADESQLNQILHIMKVAILCTSHLPGSRPSMLQVLLNLQEMPQSAIENQELVPLEVPVDPSSEDRDS